jgi:hypothetical protein
MVHADMKAAGKEELMQHAMHDIDGAPYAYHE